MIKYGTKVPSPKDISKTKPYDKITSPRKKYILKETGLQSRPIFIPYLHFVSLSHI